jgi:hypothetical protein
LAALLALILFWGTTAVAPAGPAEVDLLSSYTGDWAGEGVLAGGEEPQAFRCRMSISKGAVTKINYAGRCTLSSMNLSIAGTIAYNDDAQQYEAAMTSNAGFTGYAVGTRKGDRIDFGLAQKKTDQRGSTVRIGARIHLVGGAITVDYEVEFNDSGDVLTASVPFSRS